MEIKVLRARHLPTRTIGQLYLNEDFFCFTLEDKVREVAGQPVEKWKVKNETAIPKGRYKVTLEQSGRFGADCPTINRVPGFTFIRIHGGNNEHHTEGCLILGFKLNTDGTIQFGATKPAVLEFKKRLKEAKDNGEEIWITIDDLKT